MSEPKNPSEIAREALRRLAVRQLAPTPANYQACYNEIAGIPDFHPFPEAPLRALLADLPARTDEQVELLDRLALAVTRRSWQEFRGALTAFVLAGSGAAAVAGDGPVVPELPADFADRLAGFIQSVLPALGDDSSRAVGMGSELALMLRQPVVEVVAVVGVLGDLSVQARYAAEEQMEIRGSLLKLLHLIIENIGELSIDDAWLKGQVDGLLVAVTPPFTLRQLDEMERRLGDVIERQGRAKSRAVEAQQEMRQMLAEFIERLASMSQSSSVFAGRISESARQIEQVGSFEDLKPLLDGVITAAHAMAEETEQSREQLKTLQDKVVRAEAELMHLHQELDSASLLARHDPLTDALNRKGLEEALVREIASMRRKEQPLSIGLLDLDNFKKLNDRLGHEAGDGALVHIAEVTRRNMRPSDTLARYGGEEFVVLMPDTDLERGLDVMTRLQRELTKALYMAGSERILITFSAGVAQLTPEESGSDAIRRADQAMYLAKRAGKNRVMGA